MLMADTFTRKYYLSYINNQITEDLHDDLLKHFKLKQFHFINSKPQQQWSVADAMLPLSVAIF